MGILNRFKKEKEDEVKQADAALAESDKGDAQKKKPSAKKKTTSDEKKKQSSTITFSGKSPIVHPLVTEKTATLASEGKYVFVVRSNADRISVKQAIKEMYSVIPVSVNILNQKGKRVRFGRRVGRRKHWKKAIVTLPKGKTIDVFEGV